MARASRKGEHTLASATYATGATPSVDIGQAMRKAAAPASTRVPGDAPGQRSMAPSRTGKKAVVGYISREQWVQLRHLAIDEASSVQGLVLEGLDRVLEARGITPKTDD